MCPFNVPGVMSPTSWLWCCIALMMLQVHCFGGLIQVASGVEIRQRKKGWMSIASGGAKLNHGVLRFLLLLWGRRVYCDGLAAFSSV